MHLAAPTCDNASLPPRAATTAPRRVESVDELELELIRHMTRHRRQGDRSVLLWVELALLTRIGPWPQGEPHLDLAQAVGARLQHQVRRTDVVFRVADNGFAVLLDTDKAGAQCAQRRLLERLRGPYGLDKGLAHVHISIGMATAAEAQQQGSSLPQAAIDALFQRSDSPA